MEILCKTLCAIFFISVGTSCGLLEFTGDKYTPIVSMVIIIGSFSALLAIIFWTRSLEDYEDIDDIMDE